MRLPPWCSTIVNHFHDCPESDPYAVTSKAHGKVASFQSVPWLKLNQQLKNTQQASFTCGDCGSSYLNIPCPLLQGRDSHQPPRPWVGQPSTPDTITSLTGEKGQAQLCPSSQRAGPGHMSRTTSDLPFQLMDNLHREQSVPGQLCLQVQLDPAV